MKVTHIKTTVIDIDHCIGQCPYFDNDGTPFKDKICTHLNAPDNGYIIIASDHGECFGEDGLWGHSFYHEKIMTVPIIKIEKNKKNFISKVSNIFK